MKNTCYVIMPYGGDNEELQNKYRQIFEFIITPAAKKAGFQEADIIREDLSGDAGNIVRNIIDHITTSRIVIADMTGCNANVYYELGISHAFHKNSTVLICEKGTDIRFDLHGARRVEYVAGFASMSKSIDAIYDEIKARLDGKGKSDNSIHELLPELPTHLLDMMEMDDNELQSKLTEVIRERDALRIQLKNAGVRTESSHEKRSIRDILSETKKRMQYSGATLVTTLREYAEKNDLDSFLEHLTTALELRTPTLSNINSILEICSKMNNNSLLEDVLYVSRMLYPDDPDLTTRLAKILARRPGTRQDAMEMVNEAMGLKLDENGNYTIKDRSKLNSHNNLARFLDTYLAMEDYDSLIEAATFLKEHVPSKHHDMLDRNIFISLKRKGDLEAAGKMLDIIKAQNTDMAYYSIADYYNCCGDFVQEYEYIESAFLLDTEDLEYLKILAAHILNEDLIRTEEGIQHVTPAESRRAAAALLYYVLENSSSIDEELTHDVFEMMSRPRNRLEGFLDAIIPYLRNESDTVPYHLTNRYPLDCILERITN